MSKHDDLRWTEVYFHLAPSVGSKFTATLMGVKQLLKILLMMNEELMKVIDNKR